VKGKFLVTGGGGFIGSHLVESLVNLGQDVRVLDNFLTGKRENLNAFIDKIELIEGDIRDFETCERALDGVDYVLHQAALPGLPKKEGKEGSPLSPYAVTKMVGEKYMRVFSEIYGLATVSLRYFNIFGPRQDPHSQYAAVIPNFITGIIKGDSPRIFGDGEQSRDFTYVANVVKANMLAVESEDISGEVFNVACGDRITVNTLFERIRNFLHKDIDPVYDKPRPGDVRHSFADISKASKMLKYEPVVSFEEGLGETIHWYKNEE
jgi:nucleoside-diphosphate-sugar epimerase